MVAVTYADLHSLMHLNTTTLPAIATEDIIDLAIDMLNLYSSAGITRMAGPPGAKTLTLTSEQRGAVMMIARTIYLSFYKNIEPSSVGGVAVSPADVLAIPAMTRLLTLAARKLTTKAFLRC